MVVLDCYELLFLKKLEEDPSIWNGWRIDFQQIAKNYNLESFAEVIPFIISEIEKTKELRFHVNLIRPWMIGEQNLLETTNENTVSTSLWYLALTLGRHRIKFAKFLEMKLYDPPTCRSQESLLTQYLNSHIFTELHLDGIFKYGDDNTIPPEIFRCTSVKLLSLKYNGLDNIPCDIGRMTNLEVLRLTNNKLQNKSLPFTIIFCEKLHTLLLDNNLLDALPGFLKLMKSLKTVHRHGNHNYFKSTFMWYHTDVNERILYLVGTKDFMPREPETLQFWAAASIIGNKSDFYANKLIPSLLKDFISSIYQLFNICDYCKTSKLSSQPGYKVITFKNPYLGNTCVPFQHWACSKNCAGSIEIPARLEQITAAKELDEDYEKCIHEYQKHYNVDYDSTFVFDENSHMASVRTLYESNQCCRIS